MGRDAPALRVIVQLRIRQKPAIDFACLCVLDIAESLAPIADISADLFKVSGGVCRVELNPADDHLTGHGGINVEPTQADDRTSIVRTNLLSVLVGKEAADRAAKWARRAQFWCGPARQRGAALSPSVAPALS